jgi:hypothetical protein
MRERERERAKADWMVETCEGGQFENDCAVHCRVSHTDCVGGV